MTALQGKVTCHPSQPPHFQFAPCSTPPVPERGFLASVSGKRRLDVGAPVGSGRRSEGRVGTLACREGFLAWAQKEYRRQECLRSVGPGISVSLRFPFRAIRVFCGDKSDFSCTYRLIRTPFAFPKKPEALAREIPTLQRIPCR
jgi:hypothetical protein